jgi:hypothetical protein
MRIMACGLPRRKEGSPHEAYVHRQRALDHPFGQAARRLHTDASAQHQERDFLLHCLENRGRASGGKVPAVKVNLGAGRPYLSSKDRVL